jgi:GNAT superfamily N-acetyltransferase
VGEIVMQQDGTARPFTIVQLKAGDPRVDSLFEDVFKASFHPDELSASSAYLHQGLASGGHRTWVAVDEGGTVVGGLVGEWDDPPRVMLLSWLATRPGARGLGVGGPLLRAAVDAWTTEFDPCLVLSEVEDPSYPGHASDDAHGDPAARLRFYLRQGARILDLPYFQAALGSDKERVRGLHLVVLHAHPSFAGEKPDTISGTVLREYFEIYQRYCEGAVATDDEAMRLWHAIDRPGGVPFRAA